MSTNTRDSIAGALGVEPRTVAIEDIRPILRRDMSPMQQLAWICGERYGLDSLAPEMRADAEAAQRIIDGGHVDD